VRKSLSEVIINDDVAALQSALLHTKDVNYLDEYGYTPLIESVIVNDIDKLRLLLQASADVDQKDITGRTALYWAVFNNNYDIGKELLQANANPNLYNMTSEPVLSRPLLRNDCPYKDLLLKHGADLSFAYDYINAKLLGHRFELVGSVDIVDTNSIFTEVDFEGFHMEFCLALIANSVGVFRKQYVSRTISAWFEKLDVIINALYRAEKWVKYDHYLLDASAHRQEIQRWLKEGDALIVPVSQQGHAFTLIKYGGFFSIGDRSDFQSKDDVIPIYYMNRPSRLTADLVMEIAYNKNKIESIANVLKQELGLVEVASLPLRSQITGNCSWANVEAVIPVLFYMLHASEAPGKKKNKGSIVDDSFELFYRWREWDTGRSLQFCMQEYKLASPARKAFITSLLAAILVQRLSAASEDHLAWAKRIIPYLKKKDYRYVLDSYIVTYCVKTPTDVGKNLQEMLDIYDREEEL
jgi:hypothetical protein